MNKTGKIVIVVLLLAAVVTVVITKQNKTSSNTAPIANNIGTSVKSDSVPGSLPPANSSLPRLVDLGAGKCIPCKMMAPILEELKTEYAGRMQVNFIDVWENPDEAKKYNINIIPTQIFYDASGKELFRHEGFFSKEDILGKWKEFGCDLTADSSANLPPIERRQPAQPDDRPREQVCYMCDGDINLKTTVAIKTDKGDIRFCSPHCYFIMYSCFTEDKTDFEKKVSVTDFTSGRLLPLPAAIYLTGLEEKTGRPWIKAFADRAAAAEQKNSGGSLCDFPALQTNELSHRCGFCDRACYQQDAAEVVVDGGIRTWGCCSHCALGVAARTGKDIVVHERDRLTGDPITVKTLGGSIIASIEPASAVAWFGQRQKPDGSRASAGCFHQGFFTTAENLKLWLDQNPRETGKLVSIHQALADKMKLTPQQISKACKIGECAPK
jgi:thioredoxin 1